MNGVKVFAPATVGNVGPGFDVLGLALAEPGDVVEARPRSADVVITEIRGDEGRLPRDAEKNTAGIAAREVLALLGRPGGVEIRLRKGLPLASGLGSSAASACAAAFATNLLYGAPLSVEDLILPATRAEERVSGGFFADNVAPCLLGGVALIRSYRPLKVIRLGTIPGLFVALAIPELEVLTRKARAILPNKVPMEDFIANMAATSLVAAAFASGNIEYLRAEIEDRVVEPARAPLVPGFGEVKRAARDAGALLCSLSGSGPAIFALCEGFDAGTRVGRAMRSAFAGEGIRSRMIVTPVGMDGTRVI
jgi:homoserine kinase